MGYETRIYIVKKSKWKEHNENGKYYAQVLAMFDMMKCISSLVDDVFKEETDCYFYVDTMKYKQMRTKMVFKDDYGDFIAEASLECVISALEKLMEEEKDRIDYINDKEYTAEKIYRRVFLLLSALKVVYEQQRNGIWDDGDEIVVLRYGY